MKIKALVAGSVLAMALTACSSPETCGPQNCSADAQLSSQVLHTLNTYPALQVDLLRVQAMDRVVYLNGGVDTVGEYYEAQEVARAVPGVLRVVNKIEVRNRYS
jgi:osmotically-inducible protein OsmY